MWDAHSLVSYLPQGRSRGERFFQLLAQMRQNPGLYLPVIELMYLCMSLGFQGQYRLSPRGPAELDRLREETYAVIVRQRQAPEPELSPHWKGVAAPYRGVRMSVPVWVVASLALAVLAGLFVWFSMTSQRSVGRAVRPHAAVPPPRMPEIVRTAPVQPPPPHTRAGRGPPCALLEPEVEQGLVTVECKPPYPLVRLKQSRDVRLGKRDDRPALRPAAEPARRRPEGGAGHDRGGRLYRQPADQDRAVPVQLSSVGGARRSRAARCSRACSAIRRGSRRKGAANPIR